MWKRRLGNAEVKTAPSPTRLVGHVGVLFSITCPPEMGWLLFSVSNRSPAIPLPLQTLTFPLTEHVSLPPLLHTYYSVDRSVEGSSACLEGISCMEAPLEQLLAHGITPSPPDRRVLGLVRSVYA